MMAPRLKEVQYRQRIDQAYKVQVRGIDTKELVNVSHSYIYGADEEKWYENLGLDPEHYDDSVEREMVLGLMQEKLNSIEDDNSRQFIIRPDYVGNEELAACISLMHIMIRKGKCILNIYQRSQNIDNFMYDQQTYFMMCDMVAEQKKLKICEINITVASLHKFIKNGR